MCRLKYASVPINLSQSATPYKSWKLNSPYDPDPSIGGTTAAYFSELGLSYQKYICWGSSIKVYASPNVSADVPMVVACWPSVSTSTGSLAAPKDYAAMLVTPGVKWRKVNIYEQDLVVVSNKALIRTWAGVDPRGDQDWTGQAPGFSKTLDSGSDPNDILYWVVGVFAPDGIATDANTFITAEIEYFVEFNTRTVPYGYNNNSITIDIDPATDKPVDPQPPSRADEKKEAGPPKDDIMSDSVFIDRLKTVVGLK